MKRFANIVLGLSLFLIALNVNAAVPLLLNYQGTVKDTGGSTVNGTGYFKFAIVDSTGATSYWSNDSTSAAGSEPTASVTIPVSNGMFSVKLGDTTLPGTMNALASTVFDNASIFLRVWFSVDDVTYELLTPDTQIVSAGFSVKSESAERLKDSVYVDSYGNVGIGTANPIGILNTRKTIHLIGSLTPSFVIEDTGQNAKWIEFTSAATGGLIFGNSTSGGTSYNYRLAMLTNGNVGVGTVSPTLTLHVNGTAGGTSAWQTVSDARFKQNIKPIKSALEKVKSLRGVTYDWKKGVDPERQFSDAKQIGFIAQEVEKVVPELVHKDKKGTYSIMYSQAVPVLVEAIKEQQSTIEKLQTQLSELESIKAKLKDMENIKTQLIELKKLVNTTMAKGDNEFNIKTVELSQ